MSKMYSVVTGYQSVSVAQDLIELENASGGSVRIHEVRIGQSGVADFGDVQAEGLQVELIRYSDAGGAFTSGSGGAAVTPEPYSSSDVGAAASAAERNNTTVAVVGTGQEDVLVQDAFNVQAGFHWLPTPEIRVDLQAGEAFVVRIPTAPADAISEMVCTVVFEEI